MKVFKFGGASLKDIAAIKNIVSIIQSYSKDKLLVVVSAMGKTTDALEKIISLSHVNQNFDNELNSLKEYHLEIVNGLFSDSAKIKEALNSLFIELKEKAMHKGEYDFVYDQVICFGEIISSVIVYHFLLQENLATEWIDSRKYILTDSTFREGQVQWNETSKKIQPLSKTQNKIIVAQGFIGSNEKGETVSLGREGSDFTAAIFGSSLKVESVTIWKDVPGVMSADPRRIASATVFDELPYKETAEMTYYGASVIHPKTVKPLANKNIPLLVKSFIDPKLEGTKIYDCYVHKLPPLIVHKTNQCLISCKVTDYTFIDEQQLGVIFKVIHENGMHINLMQNSAISFSFCVDYREHKVMKLIQTLSKNFEVYYNSNLTLITIKNYDAKTFEEYRTMKGAILEQSSRTTLQVLVKDFK